jgi:hypothetical protein
VRTVLVVLSIVAVLVSTVVVEVTGSTLRKEEQNGSALLAFSKPIAIKTSRASQIARTIEYRNSKSGGVLRGVAHKTLVATNRISSPRKRIVAEARRRKVQGRGRVCVWVDRQPYIHSLDTGQSHSEDK